MNPPPERLQRIALWMFRASAASALVAVPAALLWLVYIIGVAIPAGFASGIEGTALSLTLALIVGFGFWLLRGYQEVKRGEVRSPSFWWVSAGFNAAGVVWHGWVLLASGGRTMLFDSTASWVGCVVVGVMWTGTMVALSLRAAHLAKAMTPVEWSHAATL